MRLRYPRVKREGGDEKKREEKEKKKREMYKTAMRKRGTRGRERERHTRRTRGWSVGHQRGRLECPVRNRLGCGRVKEMKTKSKRKRDKKKKKRKKRKKRTYTSNHRGSNPHGGSLEGTPVR